MLDTVDKLIHAYKNIEKIEEMDGYSNGGDWTASGNYGRDYSRGRHYVRGHYSYRDGKERLMSQMDEMMRDGSLSERDRDSLSKAMSALR